MRSPVQLPPQYDPDLQVLGSGGFGTVYRTVDRDLGRPVAVKVPFRRGGGDAGQDVLVELRAGATLRHPGFIQILDADVDPDGVPYLVMEYAGAGSMEGLVRQGAMPWREAAPLLRGVLDALGFAHAQGLIHRDIKPDNVLLQRDPAGALLPKIADFGLAKVLMRQGSYQATRLGAGTLLYMPPEAFTADSSSLHPGADLYAFGVLLYVLVGGRRPWAAEDMALIWAKAQGEHERFTPPPGSGCPEQLADVIDGLLASDPARRPQLAADVRRALFGGDDHLLSPPAGDGEESAFAEPAVVPRVRVPDAPPVGAPVPPYRATAAISVVRPPRFVDRVGERSALWGLVGRAAREPVGGLVTGGGGMGRSRLVRWATESLEQAGLGRTLRVRVGGGSSPTHALGVGLRRFLHLGRHEGVTLRRFVEQKLDALDLSGAENVLALCDWLGSEAEPGAGFLDARQLASRRLALAEAVLRAEAARGLVVLWFEEESEDPASFELASALLRSARAAPYPLLLLYEAAGGSAPSEVPKGWESLAVPALPEADLRELLEDLGAEGNEADRLVRRAAGSPARAVESVRLSRSPRIGTGATAPAPTAALRAPGRGSEVLPAASVSQVSHIAGSGLSETLDPSQVAASHLRGFEAAAADARTQEDRALVPLLLALLPQPCPEERLRGAWRLLRGADEGLDAALDAARLGGLVDRDADDALRFSGPALLEAAREGLAARVDRDALRRACADSLLESEDPGLRRHAARLRSESGLHLEALDLLIPLGGSLAGRDAEGAARIWEESLGLVSAAALPPMDPRRVRVELGRAAAARELGDLETADEQLSLLDPAALPPSDAAEWWERRASILLLRAELGAAGEHGERALELYEAAGDLGGAARARLLVADALARAGRREEALPVFEEAVARAAEAGAEREELGARWLLARCLRVLRRTDPARAELDRVLALARRHGVAVAEGSALRELGNLEVLAGRPERAEELYRRSVERLEAAGLRGEAAVTQISSGESARARGDLPAARRAYSTALAVTRAYDLRSETLAALINLGITELALGRERWARRRLAEIEEVLPSGTAHGLRVYVDALRVAVRASEGDWEGAEEAVEELLDLGRLPPDRDVLWLLEEAARRADANDEVFLAGEARGLALGVARAMGDDEAVDRIRGALSETR